MDEYKLNRASELEEEAARLRLEAFEERPLPDFWRLGQKVRTLKDNEWAWDKGAIMTIVRLREVGVPAAQYQVFWVTPRSGQGVFWTTPADVELVAEE